MSTSVYLARLIGPVALVVGIAVFLNGRGFRTLAEEFLKGRPLLYISAVLTMTGGLAVILSHNLWVAGWPVLITVLGWLAAISGALRILFPDQVEEIGRSVIRHPMGMNLAGAIWLAVGAVLSIAGYF